MARVELTQKICPICAAHLELHIENVAYDPNDPARTARVARVLKCPGCGFSREDSPPQLKPNGSR